MNIALLLRNYLKLTISQKRSSIRIPMTNDDWSQLILSWQYLLDLVWFLNLGLHKQETNDLAYIWKGNTPGGIFIIE